MAANSYTERALEDLIEAHLIEHGGWLKGSPTDFDAELALTTNDLFAFVQATQPDTWNKLRQHHQTGLEAAILDRLTRVLDSKGTLDVVRHGFKFFGQQINLATFRPAHGLNPEIGEKYAQNRLVVTRQVKFNPKGDESIDMLLSLNGLPIATVELKNQLTGQNVDDAIKQYKRRDPKCKPLQFKRRALVHFAVGPERVAMTTHLRGKDTVFLPFNRGHNGGAGNPPHPSGIRTAYLWEDVWQRDSFLDIIARFLHLERDEERDNGKKRRNEVLIFPRYHQLDCVRKLEAASRVEGPGHEYLVQHSAGSGKSNSIAWLAHRLQSLHDDHDAKVFDSVVVITDRRVLDKQLQDTIYQFEHKAGVVQCIDKDSTQLANALASGTPIIITTLQKFPFVTEKIGQLPQRTYAIIVDEAHSSQTGEAARELKAVLGSAEDALLRAETEDGGEELTYEDEIVRVMLSRGKQANLSFFAFTATPKAKTLEAFGRKSGEDNKPRPFHLYSMRQAIEEGFILDVLKHYTTYKTYYRLVKAIEDDPQVDKKKAAKTLARFMSLHPHNIAQKTEVMVSILKDKLDATHVMPFTDADLETLYTFGRFLLLHLPKPEETDDLHLDEEVQLAFYRIQKTSEGDITLVQEGEGEVYGPTDVGKGHQDDEKVPLSEIIDLLNERFGTDFKPEDQLTIDQFVADAKADTEIQKRARANAFDNFALALRQPMEGIIIDRMDRNEQLVTRYLNDAEFREMLFTEMAKRIYDDVRTKTSD